MAKLTIDELIEAFKELTLIELSEFVKAFEETFDVKAAGAVQASLAKAAHLFAAPATQAVRTVDALRDTQEAAA